MTKDELEIRLMNLYYAALDAIEMMVKDPSKKEDAYKKIQEVYDGKD